MLIFFFSFVFGARNKKDIKKLKKKVQLMEHIIGTKLVMVMRPYSKFCSYTLYFLFIKKKSFTKSKLLSCITDDLNKTIQSYHPSPTDQSIDLFSDIPLANSQPPWNPQDHSSPPSDFFEPSLKTHPLPTNAWWQNLGNFLYIARITDCGRPMKPIFNDTYPNFWANWADWPDKFWGIWDIFGQAL